jgi:hypothetical protein
MQNLKLMFKLYKDEAPCVKALAMEYRKFIIETGKEMLK